MLKQEELDKIFNSVHRVGHWGIVRFSTFSDEDLAQVLHETEREFGGVIHSVVYMGNNCENVRIYQIIYRV